MAFQKSDSFEITASTNFTSNISTEIKVPVLRKGQKLHTTSMIRKKP